MGGSDTLMPMMVEGTVGACSGLLQQHPELAGVVVHNGATPQDVNVDLLCETQEDRKKLEWGFEVAQEMAEGLMRPGVKLRINKPQVAEGTNPGLAKWAYYGKEVAYATRDEETAKFWGLPKGNAW